MAHLLTNYKIKINPDKSEILNIVGVDMQAKMPILYYEWPYIVFRRNGFTGWSGVGKVSYYPPDYYLMELTKVDDNIKIKQVLNYVEVNIKTWRTVRNFLIKKAKLLVSIEQSSSDNKA